MAKTNRDYLRRNLAQALHNLEKAEACLGPVWTEFEPVHPEYAASLLLIGQTIKSIRESILKFWLWAWGKLPDNIDGYRR